MKSSECQLLIRQQVATSMVDRCSAPTSERPKTAMIITRPITRQQTRGNVVKSTTKRPVSVPKLKLTTQPEIDDENLTSIREIRGFFHPASPDTEDVIKPLFLISKKESKCLTIVDNSIQCPITTSGSRNNSISGSNTTKCKQSNTKEIKTTEESFKKENNPRTPEQNIAQLNGIIHMSPCSYYQHKHTIQNINKYKNYFNCANKSNNENSDSQTCDEYKPIGLEERKINFFPNLCKAFNENQLFEKCLNDQAREFSKNLNRVDLDKTPGENSSETISSCNNVTDNGNITDVCNENNYTLNMFHFPFVKTKTMTADEKRGSVDNRNHNIRWVAYKTTRRDETSHQSLHIDCINTNSYVDATKIKKVQHVKKSPPQVTKDPIQSPPYSTGKLCGNKKTTVADKSLKTKIFKFELAKLNVISSKFYPKNTMKEVKENSDANRSKGRKNVLAAVNLKPRKKANFVKAQEEDKPLEVIEPPKNENKPDLGLYEISNAATNKTHSQVHGIEVESDKNTRCNNKEEYKDDASEMSQHFRGILATPPYSSLKKTGSASSSVDKKQKVKFDLDIEVHIVPRDSYLPSPTESTTTELDERDFQNSLEDDESDDNYSNDLDESYDSYNQDLEPKDTMAELARNKIIQNMSPFRVIRNDSGYGKKNNYSMTKRDSFDLAHVQKLLSQQARERVLMTQQMTNVENTRFSPQRFRAPPRTPFASAREYRHSHHQFPQHAPKQQKTNKHHQRKINVGVKTPEEFVTFYSRQQQLQRYLEYERRLRRQQLYSGQIRNHSGGKNSWENEASFGKEQQPPVLDNRDLSTPKPHFQNQRSFKHSESLASNHSQTLFHHHHIEQMQQPVSHSTNKNNEHTDSSFSSSYPNAALHARFHGVESQRPHSHHLVTTSKLSRGGNMGPEYKHSDRRLSRERTKISKTRHQQSANRINYTSLTGGENIGNTFAKMSEDARRALKEAHNTFTQSVHDMNSTPRIKQVRSSLKGVRISSDTAQQKTDNPKELERQKTFNNTSLKYDITNKVSNLEDVNNDTDVQQHNTSMLAKNSVLVSSLGLNASIPLRRKVSGNHWAEKYYKSNKSSAKRTNSKNALLIDQARTSSDDYVALLKDNKLNRKSSTVSQAINLTDFNDGYIASKVSPGRGESITRSSLHQMDDVTLSRLNKIAV